MLPLPDEKIKDYYMNTNWICFTSLLTWAINGYNDLVSKHVCGIYGQSTVWISDDAYSINEDWEG